MLGFSGSLFAQQSAEDNYNKKCAVCHGKDGLGNTAKGKKVHVKDVHANMKDSAADMIKAVTDGKGDDMDSYKSEFSCRPDQGPGGVLPEFGEVTGKHSAVNTQQAVGIEGVPLSRHFRPEA